MVRPVRVRPCRTRVAAAAGSRRARSAAASARGARRRSRSSPAPALRRLRRDRDGLPERIEDARAAPEREVALAADAVGHHDRHAVGQRVEAQVGVPAGRVVEVATDRFERGACRDEHQRCALRGREMHERRIPGVGADHRRDAPAGSEVERSSMRVAGGEMLAVVELAVGREVDLAMHVDAPRRRAPRRRRCRTARRAARSRRTGEHRAGRARERRRRARARRRSRAALHRGRRRARSATARGTASTSTPAARAASIASRCLRRFASTSPRTDSICAAATCSKVHPAQAGSDSTGVGPAVGRLRHSGSRLRASDQISFCS